MNPMMPLTLPLSEDWCPGCGALIECATMVTETDKVSPGDLSICASCAAVLQFGPDLKVAVLSEGVLENLDGHDRRMLDELVTLIQRQNGRSHRAPRPALRGEA